MVVFSITQDGNKKLADFLQKSIKFVKSPRRFYSWSKLKLLKDIQQHFFDERGPSNKWRKLSQTTLSMRRKGSGAGSPNILRDSGTMFSRLIMYSDSNQAAVGSNMSYAELHQVGGKTIFNGATVNVPKRQFMWLSKKAGADIMNKMLKMLKEN